METQTKTIGRAKPNGEYLEATVTKNPNTSIGYTIVGALWEKHGHISGRAQKRLGREADAFGQITYELAQTFPNLVPLLRVHLADPDGVPLFTIENGWFYYVNLTVGPETGRDVAARYLRIPLEATQSALPLGLSREEFKDAVNALRPMWAEQMEQAHKVFDSLVDGEGVEAVR